MCGRPRYGGSRIGSVFHCYLGGCKRGHQVHNFYLSFLKPSVPELNFPRNLSSRVARPCRGYFKGIKISTDNSLFYPICGNSPHAEQTPEHIFQRKAFLASLFKFDASPQEFLCIPQALDLALLFIEALGTI
ncbi:hypothetical protein TNCV_1668951 [Trichonephila clavipes]|nr:hypothetical protein TNCV_1668951 [Trichonephila clavipes]